MEGSTSPRIATQSSAPMMGAVSRLIRRAH
jgi:hypothetical protein